MPKSVSKKQSKRNRNPMNTALARLSKRSKQFRQQQYSQSKLPIPHKGFLGQYGYQGVKLMPESKRHQALKRAIKGDGFRKTIGHLVLIANFTSRSDPAAYAIFKRDQEWVSMLYKKFKLNHFQKSRSVDDN